MSPENTNKKKKIKLNITTVTADDKTQSGG